MKISKLKKNSFFFLSIIVAYCVFTSCCKDEKCTDCVNYSGCLDELNEPGEPIHELLGKFVMSYDECLLNDIPESIDSIKGDFAPIRETTNPYFTFSEIENCKIPFYAHATFNPSRPTEMQDSINANFLLTFNKKYDNVEFKVLAIDWTKKYDNVEFKVLAIDWTVNGDIKKINNTSIDFYVKPDDITTYSINCKIYSTDFENVYIKSFNSCFVVGEGRSFNRPIFSCGNYTSHWDLDCACIKEKDYCITGYGTIAIILPSPN